MFDDYDIREQDTLDNIIEYAEAERHRTADREFCPDCDSEITRENPLIEDWHNPESYGSCVECYDPTPAGPEYSKGFEMNH